MFYKDRFVLDALIYAKRHSGMGWQTCTGALAFLPGMSVTSEATKKRSVRAFTLRSEAQSSSPELLASTGVINAKPLTILLQLNCQQHSHNNQGSMQPMVQVEV